MNNTSSLPSITHFTDARLSDITVNSSTISSILKSLNPNKAHGCDNISIQMIKLCDDQIIKPLEMIFTNCLSMSYYPTLWKRANVTPVHKKSNKNDIKNYRPISLLPIFSKVFEKIIFNEIFGFLESNQLLSKNQSGFRSGDSCVSQLLSITHEIYRAFDCNPSLEV